MNLGTFLHHIQVIRSKRPWQRLDTSTLRYTDEHGWRLCPLEAVALHLYGDISIPKMDQDLMSRIMSVADTPDRLAHEYIYGITRDQI